MTPHQTQAERITALEVTVEELKATIEKMDKKMDDLLTLKNQGMGAFWMASIIIGAVFATLLTTISGFFHK